MKTLRSRLLWPLMILCFPFLNSYAQLIDNSFKPGFTTNDLVYDVAANADGSIIVAGKIKPGISNVQYELIKLKADGSRDLSFISGDVENGLIVSVKVLTDGNILVGGRFQKYNGTAASNLIRLKSNGAPDPNFKSAKGLNGSDDYIQEMVPLPNGQTLIAGDITRYNDLSVHLIARINSDGTVDPTFKPTADYVGEVETIALQPDGKILVGGQIYNARTYGNHVPIRLNADGTLDPTFKLSTSNLTTVTKILVLPDKKIVIGGDFNTYNNTEHQGLVRLLSDGTVDNSFITGSGFAAARGGGLGGGVNYVVADMELQTDGKLLVCGTFYSYNEKTAHGLISINTNGSSHSAFNTCATNDYWNGKIYELLTLPGGQLLIAGDFDDYQGNTGSNQLLKLNTVNGEPAAVKADFDFVVNGRTASFENKSTNGISYSWSMDRYQSSTVSNPSYTFSRVGEFNVRLIAYGNCGIQNSITKQINIVDLKNISPQRGGNTGSVTINIAGAGFTRQHEVSLSIGAARIKGYNILPNQDGTSLQVTFDLYNAAQGIYDLTVKSGSNQQVLTKIFTVEATKPLALTTAITGRDVIRTGIPQSYTFDVANGSNIDAKGAILWIALPHGSDLVPENFEIVARKNLEALATDSAMYFTIDSLFGLPEKSDVLGLVVRNVPAYGKVSFKAKITLNNSGSLHAWISSPLYGSPLSKGALSCLEASKNLLSIIDDVLGRESLLSTLKGCIESSFDAGTELYFYANNLVSDYDVEWKKTAAGYEVREYHGKQGYDFSDPNRNYDKSYTVAVAPILVDFAYNCFKLTTYRAHKGFGSFHKAIKRTIGRNASGAGPRSRLIAKLKPKKQDEINGSILYNAVDKLVGKYITGKTIFEFIDNASDCKDWISNLFATKKAISTVASFDPNEKIGPKGNNAGNHHKGTSTFDYTIYFENKSTATAPAQEVVILDTLDISKYQMSTFRFGVIGFGQTINRMLAANSFEYSVSNLVKRTGKPDLLVRTDAKLDTLSGIVKWRFITLDPITKELIDDPLDGFLPPNLIAGTGEGLVSFSILPKSNLGTGTTIKNKASIFFDANKPIVTNLFTNTIDKANPVSKIAALSDIQSNPTFTVRWSGTDAGAGIAGYDIYYAVNRGAFRLWINNIRDSERLFYGEQDSTYQFISIAKDYAGNMESEKTIPEASTTVHFSLPVTNYKILTTDLSCRNSGNGKIEIEATQPLKYTATLTNGANNTTYNFEKQLIVDKLPAGTYQLCFTLNDRPEYKQCFQVKIGEPQDLSVLSSIDKENKNVVFNLKGANRYTIEINGAIYTRTDSVVTLPVKAGPNKIKVSTDITCQTVFEETLVLPGVVEVYPNPVQKILHVRLPVLNKSTTALSIYDLTGRQIYNKEFMSRDGLIEVDAGFLQTGIYVLKVSNPDFTKTFKLIKE